MRVHCKVTLSITHVNEVGELDEDPGIVLLCAPDAPGDHANLDR